MRTGRLFLLALSLLASLPALAADIVAAAPAAPAPLRFIGAVEKATVTQNGVSQVVYKVTPQKPIRIATSGAMTLVVTARAIVVEKNATAPSPTLTFAVTGTSGGVVLATLRESITVDGSTRLPVSAGLAASAQKTVRVPIAQSSTFVEITSDEPGALVTFSRTAYAAPVATTATGTEPRLDDSVLAAIPLIRKSVERFSVGAKAGMLVPGGADQGFGSLQNMYVGAELRFTPPQLERRLSVSLEGGVYQVRDRETILGAEPIGSSDGGDVVIATRVSPLLVGVGYRFELGDTYALRASTGFGASVNARTEEVRFRADKTHTETRPAAFVRAGLGRRIGRGRAVALETGWLHDFAGRDDGYVGGFVTTVHYRMLY